MLTECMSRQVVCPMVSYRLKETIWPTQIFLFSITEQTSCSLREKRIEHCLTLGRWQGPPHINKVKQCEIVLSFTISLFIQSRKWRQLVYCICLGTKKSLWLKCLPYHEVIRQRSLIKTHRTFVKVTAPGHKVYSTNQTNTHCESNTQRLYYCVCVHWCDRHGACCLCVGAQKDPLDRQRKSRR